MKFLQSKIDTNTQEDVVKHIKSEMDDFKPCCVKLERLSDRFLTTGNHTQKRNGKLNYFSPPVKSKVEDYVQTEVLRLDRSYKCIKHKGAEFKNKGKETRCGNLTKLAAQLTRLIVNTITTLVRRSRTKTELSQEVNRKVTPTKRKRGPLLTHEPVVTGWLANTPSPWWEAFSPALSVTTPSQEAKRTCREEGCYGLVRGVSVLNMEEEGIFVKKKGVLNGLLEEVKVLNTEGLGLGRNVMKRGCSCRAQKGDDTTMVQVNSSWTLIPPSLQPSVIRSLRAVPGNRVASPLLPHIHSHSDDLDRDLTAHHESPLDVDQGPPRAGTFPRLTDEKQPTYRVCKPLVMISDSPTMRFKEKISNYGGMAIFTFPITTTPDVEKNRINWTRSHDPLRSEWSGGGHKRTDSYGQCIANYHIAESKKQPLLPVTMECWAWDPPPHCRGDDHRFYKGVLELVPQTSYKRTDSYGQCIANYHIAESKKQPLLPVDIGTQEDMDITIKSEPDNYKSCFVKLEHLTDGFLKILENIKVDTNTKEDVVIPIKSEMDNLKPCCVKLERLSDTFIATGKHIKKNKGKLICLSLLGQVQGGGENIEYEGTKSLKKFIGEGCSKTALIGSKCIKQGGTRKTCKEEECSRLARGGSKCIKDVGKRKNCREGASRHVRGRGKCI
uniref:(California timema) hypothetical protein n=1 Tax=Timema californicum TaxID=61474 RepID=A0A7R9PC44_TIMCA|nr:unnamed protein product [Timema californicum]